MNYKKLIGFIFLAVGLFTTYYYTNLYFFKWDEVVNRTNAMEFQVLISLILGVILIITGVVLAFRKRHSEFHTEADILDDETQL